MLIPYNKKKLSSKIKGYLINRSSNRKKSSQKSYKFNILRYEKEKDYIKKTFSELNVSIDW